MSETEAKTIDELIDEYRAAARRKAWLEAVVTIGFGTGGGVLLFAIAVHLAARIAS